MFPGRLVDVVVTLEVFFCLFSSLSEIEIRIITESEGGGGVEGPM